MSSTAAERRTSSRRDVRAVLDWAKETTSAYGVPIRNFRSDWSNGLGRSSSRPFNCLHESACTVMARPVVQVYLFVQCPFHVIIVRFCVILWLFRAQMPSTRSVVSIAILISCHFLSLVAQSPYLLFWSIFVFLCLHALRFFRMPEGVETVDDGIAPSSPSFTLHCAYLFFFASAETLLSFIAFCALVCGHVDNCPIDMISLDRTKAKENCQLGARLAS